MWLDEQTFWGMVLTISQLQPHYIILHSAKAKGSNPSTSSKLLIMMATLKHLVDIAQLRQADLHNVFLQTWNYMK